MRIAFLTPEFPSELPDAGGLGTYVHRMARLLLQFGHEPEVFIPSRDASETTSYNGVLLHRVNSRKNNPWSHFLGTGSKRIARSSGWHQSVELVVRAWALACALEKRHLKTPFDLVQSADYFAPGLFVPKNPCRIHAIRCSWAADLYSHIDQRPLSVGYMRLERMAMRRANIAYAPSRFIAEHLKQFHNIPVQVIRPPIYNEVDDQSPPRIELPSRFLFHFGQLIKRKGTDLIARALPIAWDTVPDLTMVWSGRIPEISQLATWQSLWGNRANQIVITGPLVKKQLYAILRRSEASVLPSLIDNLPNTVIESLMFGIPVVGSRGASIDELVEEGETGHLVELGNVKDLANALTRVWQRNSPALKGFTWRSKIAEEMKPERAVANLLELATFK